MPHYCLWGQGKSMIRWWRKPWQKRAFIFDKSTNTLTVYKNKTGTWANMKVLEESEDICIDFDNCDAKPTKRTFKRRVRLNCQKVCQ